MESAEPRAEVHHQRPRRSRIVWLPLHPSVHSGRQIVKRALLNVRYDGGLLASQASCPKAHPDEAKDDVFPSGNFIGEADACRVDDRLQLGFPMPLDERHRRRGRDAKLAKFQRQDKTVELGRRVAESDAAASARLSPSAPSFCKFATILRNPAGRTASGTPYAIAKARSTTPYENFSSGSLTIAAGSTVFRGIPVNV